MIRHRIIEKDDVNIEVMLFHQRTEHAQILDSMHAR
jgi:hypothetical protein